MGADNAAAFFRIQMRLLSGFTSNWVWRGFESCCRICSSLWARSQFQIRHYSSAYGSTAWMSNSLSLNSQCPQAGCMHFLYNLAGGYCICNVIIISAWLSAVEKVAGLTFFLKLVSGAKGHLPERVSFMTRNQQKRDIETDVKPCLSINVFEQFLSVVKIALHKQCN